jgi:hypothetical protein
MLGLAVAPVLVAASGYLLPALTCLFGMIMNAIKSDFLPSWAVFVIPTAMMNLPN